MKLTGSTVAAALEKLPKQSNQIHPLPWREAVAIVRYNPSLKVINDNWNFGLTTSQRAEAWRKWGIRSEDYRHVSKMAFLYLGDE